MPRREEMTCSKKQQQEPIWKKKQQDARTLTAKKPTLKTRHEEKAKIRKNGFRNFSQKGANNPCKKVRGYSAICPKTKKLAEAAKRRSQAGQESKRNYTQKHTQSSPALVVLWSRNQQPKIQQQEMPPSGRSAATPKGR